MAKLQSLVIFLNTAEVQEYWHNMSMGLVRCPSGNVQLLSTLW